MNRALRIAPLTILAAVLTLCAAPAAFAGEVYQWKDANGVTHYSQTPPPQGKYAARSIYHREPVADNQAAPAAPAESQQCLTARGNIELLQSGAKLRLDSDGDGKADKDLDDSERAEQLRIAQTVARVNCSRSTAKAP
jgi:Domain of unknown function (DUF4124)